MSAPKAIPASVPDGGGKSSSVRSSVTDPFWSFFIRCTVLIARPLPAVKIVQRANTLERGVSVGEDDCYQPVHARPPAESVWKAASVTGMATLL